MKVMKYMNQNQFSATIAAAHPNRIAAVGTAEFAAETALKIACESGEYEEICEI
jgi:hypothetical protein